MSSDNKRVYEEKLDENKHLVIYFSAVDSDAGRPAYYWAIEFLDEEGELSNSETNRQWYNTLEEAESAGNKHFEMVQLVSREEVVETYLDNLYSKLEFSENHALPALIRNLLYQRQHCLDCVDLTEDQITEIYTYLLAINWEGLYPIPDYA